MPFIEGTNRGGAPSKFPAISAEKSLSNTTHVVTTQFIMTSPGDKRGSPHNKKQNNNNNNSTLPKISNNDGGAKINTRQNNPGEYSKEIAQYPGKDASPTAENSPSYVTIVKGNKHCSPASQLKDPPHTVTPSSQIDKKEEPFPPGFGDDDSTHPSVGNNKEVKSINEDGISLIQEGESIMAKIDSELVELNLSAVAPPPISEIDTSGTPDWAKIVQTNMENIAATILTACGELSKQMDTKVSKAEIIDIVDESKAEIIDIVDEKVKVLVAAAVTDKVNEFNGLKDKPKADTETEAQHNEDPQVNRDNVATDQQPYRTPHHCPPHTPTTTPHRGVEPEVTPYSLIVSQNGPLPPLDDVVKNLNTSMTTETTEHNSRWNLTDRAGRQTKREQQNADSADDNVHGNDNNGNNNYDNN